MQSSTWGHAARPTIALQSKVRISCCCVACSDKEKSGSISLVSRYLSLKVLRRINVSSYIWSAGNIRIKRVLSFRVTTTKNSSLPLRRASSLARTPQDNSTTGKLFSLVCSRQNYFGRWHSSHDRHAQVITYLQTKGGTHGRAANPATDQRAPRPHHSHMTRTAKSVLWPRSIFSASQTMWAPSRRPAGEWLLCGAATSPCIP
ncbi:uncharacterized protein LOC119326330 isoform X2 [Triticum dicoccoides]|uniref:uncharacterized protein LOC119326330 isoform X2 n=1 Tax=Triticum dicoccoides TaxID=85692 RepID=UPI0018919392|nr:uncharacterized protein LOC119326330 isoform X2 [Triticum dicoccoides]